MKITFDSNAWEKVFDTSDKSYELIRSTLHKKLAFGFICEAAFRIEAIMKKDRAGYFDQPFVDFRIEGMKTSADGQSYLHMSMGSDDKKHPGIPKIQMEKFKLALNMGIKVMRGLSWIGLPRPSILDDRTIFVTETKEEFHRIDQCQVKMMSEFKKRKLLDYDFRKLGGWDKNFEIQVNKKFVKACAEWADGELAIAHICYQNDFLCTDDTANSTGRSIFDAENRKWLSEIHGVRFISVQDLLEMLQ